MSEQNIAGPLYVGTVYVDVGYDMARGPTAETIDWLGATDLGGSIRVDLVRYAFGDDDLYEGDPPHGSVGMWKMLLTEMRDMLARCFVLGEMKVVGGERLNTMLDEEEDRNLDEAITELGDEKFLIKITPEIALAALKKRARDEQAVTDGLKLLGRLMQVEGLARGLNREERRKMTIGDLIRGPRETEEGPST